MGHLDPNSLRWCHQPIAILMAIPVPVAIALALAFLVLMALHEHTIVPIVGNLCWRLISFFRISIRIFFSSLFVLCFRFSFNFNVQLLWTRTRVRCAAAAATKMNSSKAQTHTHARSSLSFFRTKNTITTQTRAPVPLPSTASCKSMLFSVNGFVSRTDLNVNCLLFGYLTCRFPARKWQFHMKNTTFTTLISFAL